MAKMHKYQGSSLIEILVATSLAAMVLVAIAGVAMYSLDRTTQAKYQDQATQLSNGMMELFFQERAKLGWQDFYNKLKSASTFCTNGESDLVALQLVSCDQPETIKLGEMIFSRQANVTIDDANQIIAVEVVTSWDGGRIGTRFNRLTHQFKQIE